MKDNNNRRYIITGAPGSGKTSILHTLHKNGYMCCEEISRKIIIGQQEIGGDKTPWGDLRGFVDLVCQQTIRELDCSIVQDTFVDRGLPDNIAYLQAYSYAVPDWLLNFPFKKYYASVVFLATPWEGIYTTDPQRLQSYQEALHIHRYLVAVYQELGFEIKTLPQETIQKRIDFMQEALRTTRVTT